MYKLVLQDYRSHWRSSLRRLYDNSMICFLWVFYTITGIGTHEKSELSYLCLVVPCLITYMFGRMYGGYMNKTFFLCPLDAKVRRQYAECNYRLRIIIPAILFLAGNVIMMILGYFDIGIFIVRLIIFACTAVSVNIYCQPTATDDIYSRDRYPFVGNFEILNTYSNAINVIMIIIAMHMEEYSISELATWELIIIGTCIALQLIATISKVKKFYWQSIVMMDFYQ